MPDGVRQTNGATETGPKRLGKPERRRALAAISVMPTLFTLGNLVAGFAAIHYAAKPVDFSGPWGWSSLTLAGALIYISSTGDAVLGGGALLALGLGMGVPLVVIGASGGHLLPRAGAWMNSVKAVFGVLLLAVAVHAGIAVNVVQIFLVGVVAEAAGDRSRLDQADVDAAAVQFQAQRVAEAFQCKF